MAEKLMTDGSMALREKQYRVITIEATEKPQNAKLRVAAYARVSSASDDQLNSFAAQNRHYSDLISSKENWRMVDIYADEGITGTSAEKREDFQRLLADCRRGLIDRVLVKSISRFARNTKECLETIRELKSLGVGVYFEKENIDTATMSGEMMTALFASFAQAESESISGNMRWGIQKRMQAGTYIPANLPYGYTLQDHSIRIVEEQAVIVQRIFKEYLSGKSTERIASDLREEGIPCKSGEVAWDSTAIRYIISNEKYIGDSVWQKYFSTDTLPYKCRLNRGQKVSYYAYGTHEGIVPKEDFEKANALMKSRAQKITLTKNSPYAFRKKIVCGDCQSLFRRKVVRGITYWVCIGHDKKRHGLKCGITPIAEDEITNELECTEHDQDTFSLPRQYLQKPDGRVYHEGSGEESRSGAEHSNRVGSYQHRGDWQSGVPAGSPQAVRAWHRLFWQTSSAAPEQRLREVRPSDWHGSGQPAEYVPDLRWRFCRQDAPADGLYRPPRRGSRSVVHRRFRHDLAGCGGRLSGIATPYPIATHQSWRCFLNE